MKFVAVLLFGNFALNFGATRWAERYAPRYPDARHPFAVHFKGDLVVFVHSWLGYYIEWGFWGHFLLVAIFGTTLWWFVRRGRAVGHPVK